MFQWLENVSWWKVWTQVKPSLSYQPLNFHGFPPWVEPEFPFSEQESLPAPLTTFQSSFVGCSFNAKHRYTDVQFRFVYNKKSAESTTSSLYKKSLVLLQKTENVASIKPLIIGVYFFELTPLKSKESVVVVFTTFNFSPLPVSEYNSSSEGIFWQTKLWETRETTQSLHHLVNH